MSSLTTADFFMIWFNPRIANTPQTTFVTITLESPKIEQCAFVTFPRYVWGYKMLCLSVVTPCTKNPMWRHKNWKCTSRLLSFVTHIISRVLGHIVTKFQRLHHVFEVHLFSGVVDNVTGNHIILEIDMAAAKPKVTLSQHIGQVETKFQRLTALHMA